MNKIKYFSFVLITILFSACQFNQQVNKDLSTGAYFRGDGLGSGDVLIQVNGEIDNRNKFVYGEKVEFIFADITGLVLEDGIIGYPGMSMTILKDEKDTVLHSDDLFAEDVEGFEMNPSQLSAYFHCFLPYENQESYKMFLRSWDKKGTGSFLFEMPFTVEANKLLEINNQKIGCEEIYLWNETRKIRLVKEEVNMEDELALIFKQIDGLEVVNGKVFPILAIDIRDNSGEEVISSPNVLAEYTKEGIDYEELKVGRVPVTIRFTSGEIRNPYKIKATLSDLNSDRRIDVVGKIRLKEKKES